ncbi:hypothetical protein B9Z55_011619 [Caenorhabditis nigoni]|nr:hypothetical protein B9Z55_011619 [Caenorhabditis nigoni]
MPSKTHTIGSRSIIENCVPQVYGNGARTNRSSPYEPIVPPPSESPPDPLNSRVESSAVYSTDRSDYR